MHRLFRFAFCSLLVALAALALAGEKSAQWSVALSSPDPAVGAEIEIVFTADLPPGWILYSSDFKAEIGPQPTEFSFTANDSCVLIGSVVSLNPKRKKDKTWDTELGYFEHRGVFRQRIKILKKPFTLAGRVKGQLCNESEGTCEIFDQPIPTWK